MGGRGLSRRRRFEISHLHIFVLRRLRVDPMSTKNWMRDKQESFDIPSLVNFSRRDRPNQCEQHASHRWDNRSSFPVPSHHHLNLTHKFMRDCWYADITSKKCRTYRISAKCIWGPWGGPSSWSSSLSVTQILVQSKPNKIVPTHVLPPLAKTRLLMPEMTLRKPCYRCLNFEIDKHGQSLQDLNTALMN